MNTPPTTTLTVLPSPPPRRKTMPVKAIATSIDRRMGHAA